MKNKSIIYLLICVFGTIQCKPSQKNISATNFPSELVNFVPYKNNPVFTGAGPNDWDKQIRERGYILKEGNTYHLWYTGYSNSSKDPRRFLGYATSSDGINWNRFSKNTIHENDWVEDMYVVKSANTYYMFAEGQGDTAHLLTSTDKIHWDEKGPLDIRQKNGSPIAKGAFGTPTVYIEKGIWYLFYERDDKGIWLATSTDHKAWTNLQDEPILAMGPETYDQYGIAMNQVIKYKGLYYGYYHATAFKDWHEWSTNIAVSADLIHWKKYVNNPIIENNQSSGIVVIDGKNIQFYTMHRKVNMFLPK